MHVYYMYEDSCSNALDRFPEVVRSDCEDIQLGRSSDDSVTLLLYTFFLAELTISGISGISGIR